MTKSDAIDVSVREWEQKHNMLTRGSTRKTISGSTASVLVSLREPCLRDYICHRS